MAGPTHYEVLGVAADASVEVIRASWRRIAKECHPDRARGDVEKTLRFVAANTAQETLLDAEKRAAYDAELREPEEDEDEDLDEEVAYGRPTGVCIHCGRPTHGHLPVCFACVVERRDALRAAEQARRARVARVRQEREAWLRQMRRVWEAEERAQRAKAEQVRQRAQRAALQQAMREAAARKAAQEARRRPPQPQANRRRAWSHASEQERLEAEYGHLTDSSRYTGVFERSMEDYGAGVAGLDSEDLLQAMMGEAAIRSARVRAGGRGGVRVTVQVDRNVSVELDERTLAAVKEIGKSLGRANRVMGLLRRWFT